METHPLLDKIFRFIIAKRWWVVAIYALLLPPSVYCALRVEQDNSIDRLIVPSDPDFQATQGFAEVFGAGEFTLLVAEAPDPFSLPCLQKLQDIETALENIPHTEVNSAFTTYRHLRPGFVLSRESAQAFAAFANGTDLFRKQSLVGPGFLSIALLANVQGAAARAEFVSSVGRALAPFEADLSPLTALRKVGEPFVNTNLDETSHRASLRYFPLFVLFAVALTLFLYRSRRALFAFVIVLGESVALTVGYIGLTGGTFTIVSALVPMTILITCTATLVYIHSRFVEKPADRSIDDHQVFALANKFLACTASMFATAVGFAALMVSSIRPIREMGLWVAIGVVFTWVTVFTLFPALQKLLNTPTGEERRTAGETFVYLARWLPFFSYRWRWVLVPSALALCLGGIVALTGIPHLISPMPFELNAIEYVNHDTALYHDTKAVESKIAGLGLSEVWIKGRFGSMTDPPVLHGLALFQEQLEREKMVGATIGVTTMLRMLQYTAGRGDQFPSDPVAIEQLAAQFETLLPTQPMLGRFVEKKQLGETHVAVVTRTLDFEGVQALKKTVHAAWAAAAKSEPALAAFEVSVVGIGPLQAKISHNLVPTLVESFVLTVGVIFVAFLLVFRNGAARLMAMIPSLFAILVMFIFMRVFGMSLNVATILIASTVLGTSENDQIHFFYHFLERTKGGGTTEQGLEHTLTIAGRAIVFATLINASGFLGFALSDLLPMRQFGILSALAFVLSMIADFTALPAALWMVFRDRPGSGVTNISEKHHSRGAEP